MAEIYNLKANGDAHFAGIVSQGGEPINDEDLVNKGFLSAQVGSISSGMNKEVFFTNGIWTVPDGVKEVWITACGGGGAGSYYSSGREWSLGINGSSTIIGDIVTLPGGRRATSTEHGAAGGPGGSSGACGSLGNVAEVVTSSSKTSRFSTYLVRGDAIGGCSLGFGGSHLMTAYQCSYVFQPPQITTSNSTSGNMFMPSYGGGGAGESAISGTLSYGGGGGDAIYRKKYTISDGTLSVPITIGVGGRGGSDLNRITNYGGADGIVIIEW